MARFSDSKSRRHRINLKGLRELEDTLKAAYRIKANVGILEDKEAADYMSKQEFGHWWKPPRKKKEVWVPARPWFRITISRDSEKIFKSMGRAFTRLVGSRTQRPTFHSIEKIIENAGKKLKRGLKETIQQHVPPPLAEITVKEKRKKGYATPETPLYRTGRAYKAIDYKIVRENPK